MGAKASSMAAGSRCGITLPHLEDDAIMVMPRTGQSVAGSGRCDLESAA